MVLIYMNIVKYRNEFCGVFRVLLFCFHSLPSFGGIKIFLLAELFFWYVVYNTIACKR